MPTIATLQTEVARRADTAKSKITIAIVSRVLKALAETLEALPELIPVVERILAKARRAHESARPQP